MIVEHFRAGLFLLLTFGILIVGTVGNLELRFATDSRSEFRVELDSKPWLSGGKFVKVGKYDTRDGSLVKVGNKIAHLRISVLQESLRNIWFLSVIKCANRGLMI